MIGDVAALGVVVLVQQAAGAESRVGEAGQLLVDRRGIRFHGVVSTEDRCQHLVIHLDKLQRLFSDVGAGGGHCGDGVPLVERLATGQHVHAEEPQVLDSAFGEVSQPAGGLGPVGRRYDGMHAGIGLGRAGVN